jgi:hypothetical protein
MAKDCFIYTRVCYSMLIALSHCCVWLYVDIRPSSSRRYDNSLGGGAFPRSDVARICITYLEIAFKKEMRSTIFLLSISAGKIRNIKIKKTNSEGHFSIRCIQLVVHCTLTSIPFSLHPKWRTAESGIFYLVRAEAITRTPSNRLIEGRRSLTQKI